MSVKLKKRRHIAQTRPNLQLRGTVTNVQKEIELPLFTLMKDLVNYKCREKTKTNILNIYIFYIHIYVYLNVAYGIYKIKHSGAGKPQK